MRLLFSAAILSDILLRSALGAVIAAAAAFAAFALRALTLSGAIAAVVVGALAYGFGNLPLAAALVVFFISGSLLGVIPAKRSQHARRQSAKGNRRDALQVLANGGVAVMCAFAASIATASRPQLAVPFLAAAIGAVAAAAGDTWSTEIGALSYSTPRSILSGRRVVPGTSGGITLVGTLAAPVGGLAIGFAALLGSGAGSRPVWLLLGLACGFFGSIIDSVVGASAQGVWHCDACSATTETALHACGARGRLIHGTAWLDNDGVNAIATAGGALLGFALTLALFQRQS